MDFDFSALRLIISGSRRFLGQKTWAAITLGQVSSKWTITNLHGDAGKCVGNVSTDRILFYLTSVRQSILFPTFELFYNAPVCRGRRMLYCRRIQKFLINFICFKYFFLFFLCVFNELLRKLAVESGYHGFLGFENEI